MDQYLLIALIIISAWLVGFGVYLLISRRQRELASNLNEISDTLHDHETNKGL